MSESNAGSPRLELAREPIRVYDSTGRKQTLSGPSADLLRILAWEPQPVEQDALLQALKSLRKREKHPRPLNGVQPLLAAVRKVVGPALKTVTRPLGGGDKYPNARYLGNFDGFSIDALDFALLANEVRPQMAIAASDLWMAPERLPDSFGAGAAKLADGSPAQEVDMWAEAQSSFTVNPSVPTNHFYNADQMYNAYAEHHWTLVSAVTLGYACRFMSDGNETWLTRAEGRLGRLGRDADLSDEIWKLRFRLVGSQSSWAIGVDGLRRRYLEANYPEVPVEDIPELKLPADIEDLVARLKARDPQVRLMPRSPKPTDWVPEGTVNVVAHVEAGQSGTEVRADIRDVDLVPRQFDSSPPEAPNEPGLLEVASKLGITPASAVALRSSKVSPLECTAQVDKRLWFSGIMANKWVLDEPSYDAFDTLLSELDSYDEQDPLCRLMIVNPESKAGLRLKRRGLLTDRELRSIPVLQDLVYRHPSFEVRMYSTLPTFRLIIVDQTFVTVAPYLNALPGLVPDRGWGVPHLVLKPSAEFPLAHSFVSMFEQSWDACRDSPLPLHRAN